MDGFAVGDATVIVLAAANPEVWIQRYYVLGVLIDKC